MASFNGGDDQLYSCPSGMPSADDQLYSCPSARPSIDSCRSFSRDLPDSQLERHVHRQLHEPISVFVADDYQAELISLSMLINACRQESVSEDMLVCYYASIVGIAYPMLSGHVRSHLATLTDRRLCRVYLPSDAGAHSLTVVEAMRTAEVWLHIGQLMLLPFKSFELSNYDGLMKANTYCIAEKLGLDPAMCSLTVSGSVAATIRRALRPALDLKREMVKHLSSNKDVTLMEGIVNNFVVRSIEYFDMEAIRSVYENLVITESPVLRDSSSRIMNECINLCEGLKAISKCPEPKYFMILADLESQWLIQGIKFPTLLAVANAVRSIEDNQANGAEAQSADCRSSYTALVHQLVSVHRSYVASGIARPLLLQQADAYLESLRISRPL